MAVETSNINISVIERLTRLSQAGKLAHAYLFVGPALAGKFETALEIAKVLNCEEEKVSPCGLCASCLKIQSGNHPDVHTTSAEDSGTIKIEQVRDILEQIRLRAFMAKVKVFVVKNVESLTPEAANALLKTLEEPSPNSLLILTTAVFENVLDTVKSRCHWVTFASDSAEDIKKALKIDFKFSDKQSHVISFFAEGCLGKARELAGNDFLKRKNRYIDEFFFSPDSDALLKEVLAEKPVTKEFLMILISWVRDVILLKSSSDEKRLLHVDRLSDLRKESNVFTVAELSDIYKQFVKAVDLLNENLNVKMTLLIVKAALFK